MTDLENSVTNAERPWLIFVSTRAPYPPVTGHFIRTYNILRQISAEYRIALFAFYDKKLPCKQKELVYSALGEVCDFVFLKSLRSEESRFGMLALLARSVIGKKPLVAYKYFDRGMVASIAEFLTDHQVTLVHFDMLPLIEYLPVAGDHPIMLTQHNIESDRLRRISSSRKGLFERQFLKHQTRKLERYEKASLENVAHCCVVSENDARAVLSLNDRCNVHLVPNGVDTKKFVPGSPNSESSQNILWVGGMNDEYNKEAVLHFAEKILPSILAQRPDVIWTVIGKSPPPQLIALAAQENVELTGMVDDLVPYYHRAAIVVVPLLSGAGTKLKVIEAMAMGKATVCTPVGAEGIATPDDEFLSVAHDDAAFADQVLALLNDSTQRARMGERARAEVMTRFDWKKIGLAQLKANEQARGIVPCAE